MLPASTVTRLSIRKQVRRCAALARPSASNELGKSSICKGRFLCLDSVQSAPSISQNHAGGENFPSPSRYGVQLEVRATLSRPSISVLTRLVATLAFNYTLRWEMAKQTGVLHLCPYPGPRP